MDGKKHKPHQKKKPETEGKGAATGQGNTQSDTSATTDNYWERISEDPAAGYKGRDDGSPILNNDQIAGDNERGDTSSKPAV